MKKSAFIFPLSILAMSLASCNFSFSLLSSASSAGSSSSPSSSSSQRTSAISTSYEPGTLTKTELKRTYVDYSAENVYAIDSAPTKGKTKLLVIPVWFTDSSRYILESKRDGVRDDIRKAYFGSTEETGWNSVKSFYETESQGRLTLEGTVSEWYEVGKAVSYYSSESTGADRTTELIPTATDWYFRNHTSESRKDYDCDGDGYLDGIMLIYAAPNYVSLRNESYSNLWAYCYWIQDYEVQNVENPGVNTYFWASYDFMYGSNTVLSRTGNSYSFGNTQHCSIDAHTYIHEMGHVFGLDDYYDYGPNSYSPAAGFSMQDCNIGGHDPFSVMAFGWADPYIPTASGTVKISAFQKSHDVILLSPGFNSYRSPFDEYLLVELFTPTGLNQLDCTYEYENIQGPKATGVRVWHVDARLTYCDSLTREGEPIYSTTLTSDVTKGTYGVLQAFSNTTGDDSYGSPLGRSYDKYNLLQIVRNNRSATYKSTSSLKSSDLFYDGDTFTMSDFRGQFPNTGLLNSSQELGWSFTVHISGSGEDAVASIELNKA